MRIPGIGRINKRLSVCFGNLRKSKFEKLILRKDFRDRIKNKLHLKAQINLELVTFASSNNFPDLLLSILSFITSAGLPAKWTIYADDEFSAGQKAIFNEFEFLAYKDWFTNISEDDREKYSGKWQFRKYLSFSTHVFTTSTVFLDSDVLFYKRFTKYLEFVKEANWYLAEPVDAFSIDYEIINREDYTLSMFLINSGFMILNKMPPWNIGMQYLAECLVNNSITHFSEQSAVNIVFVNDPDAKILEPRVFYVSTIDHFKLGFIKTDDLAIRHYVGPIRYKMWQTGWEQFI